MDKETREALKKVIEVCIIGTQYWKPSEEFLVYVKQVRTWIEETEEKDQK